LKYKSVKAYQFLLCCLGIETDLKLFVKEVKKDFQSELDSFYEVINCREDCYINLITNFTFEEASAESKVMFLMTDGGLYSISFS